MKVTLAAVFTAALCFSGCSSNNTDSTKTDSTKTDQTNTVASTSLPNQNTAPVKDENNVSTPQPSGAGTSAPVALTAEQRRGEEVFRKAYCVGCHAGGNNAMMPNKPIKGEAFSEKYKDDALLAKTIRKGFPDEGMPAFGKDQIPESQMKDLILYIRTLTP